MTLGRKLVEIRQDRGFSQATLAARGSLSQGYLSQLENDEVPNPSAIVFLNLAKGLILDPSVLFEAAGYEIPSGSQFGSMSLPVDLDLLTFCSSFSFKRQGSLLGYLSINYDPSPETPPEVSRVVARTKKTVVSRESREKLGGKIRELREQHGMSQGDLSERADISQGYMSQLEHGDIKNPSASVLLRIAKALEVDVNKLFVAAGYQTAQDLEDTYFTLCNKLIPELVGFFANFSAETQRRILSHLQGLDHLLEMSEKKPVNA